MTVTMANFTPDDRDDKRRSTDTAPAVIDSSGTECIVFQIYCLLAKFWDRKPTTDLLDNN